jgi:hypothetical protein
MSFFYVPKYIFICMVIIAVIFLGAKYVTRRIVLSTFEKMSAILCVSLSPDSVFQVESSAIWICKKFSLSLGLSRPPSPAQTKDAICINCAPKSKFGVKRCTKKQFKLSLSASMTNNPLSRTSFLLLKFYSLLH